MSLGIWKSLESNCPTFLARFDFSICWYGQSTQTLTKQTLFIQDNFSSSEWFFLWRSSNGHALLVAFKTSCENLIFHTSGSARKTWSPDAVKQGSRFRGGRISSSCSQYFKNLTKKTAVRTYSTNKSLKMQLPMFFHYFLILLVKDWAAGLTSHIKPIIKITKYAKLHIYSRVYERFLTLLVVTRNLSPKHHKDPKMSKEFNSQHNHRRSGGLI